MLEVHAREARRISLGLTLRVDQLELVPMREHQFGIGLGAHANPVQARRGGLRAIGFHGNGEATRVQGRRERLVHLQQGLATGQHHIATGAALWLPGFQNRIGQRVGRRELAAARAVRAHEVGIAELADRRGPVFLAPAPEIAARKGAEHRRPAGLGAFALQGVEDFFDGVGHEWIFAACEHAPPHHLRSPCTLDVINA